MKRQKGRPPEGTVRPRKVMKAKREMFWLVDDPRAIDVVVDALLDELGPDGDPPPKKKIRIAA